MFLRTGNNSINQTLYIFFIHKTIVIHICLKSIKIVRGFPLKVIYEFHYIGNIYTPVVIQVASQQCQQHHR